MTFTKEENEVMLDLLEAVILGGEYYSLEEERTIKELQKKLYRGEN